MLYGIFLSWGSRIPSAHFEHLALMSKCKNEMVRSGQFTYFPLAVTCWEGGIRHVARPHKVVEICLKIQLCEVLLFQWKSNCRILNGSNG